MMPPPWDVRNGRAPEMMVRKNPEKNKKETRCVLCNGFTHCLVCVVYENICHLFF